MPPDPLARSGAWEGEVVGEAWAGNRLHLAAWHQDVRTDKRSRTVAALDLATGRWKRLDLDADGELVAVADTLVFLGDGVHDPSDGRFRAT